MIWCADRFLNAPHSVSMIRSFGWDVNLFFSILSCFLFLFLSVLFYFTNFFRHQSFSFLSLKILIRRRMLRLRLPDISAACRLPVISDTFLLLWIARNITAFYTRACLKTRELLQADRAGRSSFYAAMYLKKLAVTGFSVKSTIFIFLFVQVCSKI